MKMPNVPDTLWRKKLHVDLEQKESRWVREDI